ncbi:MAG: hypothetical protein LBG70_00480 [Bifidobacteriaceae bacterium]|jgi:hypothetical protein|nr:hypothetical protein [Bifidobacteriaceae bacterium]
MAFRHFHTPAGRRSVRGLFALAAAASLLTGVMLAGPAHADTDTTGGGPALAPLTYTSAQKKKIADPAGANEKVMGPDWRDAKAKFNLSTTVAFNKHLPAPYGIAY